MRVGLVQMRSGVEIDANVADADRLIRQTADEGAAFVATPETTHLVEKNADRLFEKLRAPEDESAIPHFAALARELGITLLIGSLALKTGARRAVNRSHLFGPDGQLIATYDKIHMFDVGLGAGETYSESTNYDAGGTAVLADIPDARLGLTICYDVRFPYLYRSLAQAGAQILTVPAAFTRPTGKAHWDILLRARAIETGSYVLAPAQGGQHADGRKTWGHSLIVGPWGEVVAALDHDEPGILLADLDLAKVTAARTRIPALRHDREFFGPA
jgi:predicted amidohydrolase